MNEAFCHCNSYLKQYKTQIKISKALLEEGDPWPGFFVEKNSGFHSKIEAPADAAETMAHHIHSRLLFSWRAFEPCPPLPPNYERYYMLQGMTIQFATFFPFPVRGLFQSEPELMLDRIFRRRRPRIYFFALAGDPPSVFGPFTPQEMRERWGHAGMPPGLLVRHTSQVLLTNCKMSLRLARASMFTTSTVIHTDTSTYPCAG